MRERHRYITGGEAHHHIGEASRFHNRRIITITRTEAPAFITGYEDPDVPQKPA
jgi:hypothetical protein